MNRRSLLGAISAVALLVATGAPMSRDALAQGSGNDTPGSVYTMTNATGGNDVLIFDRDGAGTLMPAGAAATGGTGSGGGLDPLASQGSLVLTDNQRWLLAVNAGSNDVSVFRVTASGLELADIVASGGIFPTSVAVFHDLVYVLNAGGTPNIAGFTLNSKGHLTPTAGSTRALSAGLYSQVGFDPTGDALVVTHRSGNRLLVFRVNDDGTPAATPTISPSNGPGPFSFVFGAQGRLLVAEAGANAVSSYELGDDGSLTVVDPSVANGQAATCWIAGAGSRFAFTANPGSHSFSSYRQQPGKRGELVLLAGAAGAGNRPLDLAATNNGRFLYALDPGVGGIAAFRIGSGGGLTDLGALPAGLPLYAQGLAAR